MELSQTLAQEIVERAMRILPGNVNVMDASGLIIGSGDPARLFSHHAGARQVIAEGRAVALDASAAAGLAGAQAGINLPLYHQGELVGVLGVSGEDAEQLRLPAELLRLTAEMLIEQAAGQPPATARMTTPLLRQLLAFRNGTRANEAATQMTPVVEKLSLEDMIDVAAYLGSLYPPQ